MERRDFLLGAVGLSVACFTPAPIDLASVELIDPTAESFREQFNRDAQSPRLLILVSST